MAEAPPLNCGPFLVAVHAGAGWHSPAKEAAYRRVMCDAICAATAAIAAGADPLSAAVAALRVLEDSPATNAGYGSNLNAAGRVECDASVMAGLDGAFGAVGAAPGVRHPAAAAARLAEESRLPLPLGLIRPMFIVGDAARRWALSQGLDAAPHAAAAAEWLVSPEALAAWRRYTRMLREAQQAGTLQGVEQPGLQRQQQQQKQQQKQQQQYQPRAEQAEEAEGSAAASQGQLSGDGRGPQSKRARRAPSDDREGSPPRRAAANKTEEQQQQQQQQRQQQQQQQPQQWFLGGLADTVGAIVVGPSGSVAAGVSSGGLALKAEGRVGEAAVHGAGCWAEDAPSGGGAPGVAVSVTGLGEAVMRAGLARACASEMRRAGGGGGGGDPADACCAVMGARMAQGPAAVECGVLATAAQVLGTPPRAAPPAAGPGPSSEAGALPRAVCGGGGRVRVELVAAHTSPSFAVAYQAAGMARPEALLLRMQGGGSGGCAAREGAHIGRFEFSCTWGVP